MGAGHGLFYIPEREGMTISMQTMLFRDVAALLFVNRSLLPSQVVTLGQRADNLPRAKVDGRAGNE